MTENKILRDMKGPLLLTRRDKRGNWVPLMNAPEDLNSSNLLSLKITEKETELTSLITMSTQSRENPT
jgi:hypothetical protein